MSTFISHTTALECLRALSLAGRAPERIGASQSPSESGIGTGALEIIDRTVATVRLDESPKQPIDILVFNERQRKKRRGLRYHLWSGEVPSGSFYELAPGIFVASPEFCFLLLARDLSVPCLVQLGYELCGCFAFNPRAKRGFDRTMHPLTNLLRLEGFLKQARGCMGFAKAMQALRWIGENTWSPMEADIAILLTFPTKMGGYEIPFPQFNKEIRIEERLRLPNRGEKYHLDMAWSATVLEFNGEEDHAGRIQAGKDRTRELVLGQMGYTVITITGYQAFRIREFDAVVQALCASIGRRYHTPTGRQMQKKEQLRRELFGRLGANARIA